MVLLTKLIINGKSKLHDQYSRAETRQLKSKIFFCDFVGNT